MLDAVRTALRRVPLLGAIQLTLPVTVILFTLGSGSIPEALSAASKLRWAALLLFAALAALLCVARGSRLPDARVLATAGVFGVLAIASATWSVDPRLTIERAFTFVVLLGAAAALATAVSGDLEAIEGLLVSVVVGATLVCVGGLVLFAIKHADAVQAATVSTPTRWKGLGQNPNTVPMLAAFALPIALHLVLDERRLRRALGVVAFAALYATIIASGSHGGFAAAAFGLVVAGGLAEKGRGYLPVAGTVVILLVAGLGLDAVLLRHAPVSAQTTTSPATTSAAKSSPAATIPGTDPAPAIAVQEALPSMEDEIGASPTLKARTLFGDSGRLLAWRGAIKQGAKRPLLGYGFGTEERVFIDRWYYFQGSRPENSYIGLFLQLGIVGEAVFLLLGGLFGSALIRAVRGGGLTRRLGVTAGGCVAAGYALGVAQSYVYSVGNVATVSFWVVSFMLVAVVPKAVRS